MHSSVLSMPITGSMRREKSHRTRFGRSRSQPPTENRSSFLSTSSPRMKNIFGNLLHLSTHPASLSTNMINRNKLGSSLAMTTPRDRRLRLKIKRGSSITYPSSSMEIRVKCLALTDE